MANVLENEGPYWVLRYVVITVISVVIIRYFYNLLKPRLLAIMLSYFGERANVSLKPWLFQSIGEFKEEVKPNGKLCILEIGAGAGVNFQYYPQASQVIAVEPNGYCAGYLQENAEKSGNIDALEIIEEKLQDIGASVRDGSIDAVVCTFVLCSVDDVGGALREVMRILKPNGRFYFMEHVKDFHHNSWTHIAQRLIYPFLLYFGDCDCLKETNRFIDRAGFRAHKYMQYSGSKDMPFALRPTLFGYATK